MAIGSNVREVFAPRTSDGASAARARPGPRAGPSGPAGGAGARPPRARGLALHRVIHRGRFVTTPQEGELWPASPWCERRARRHDKKESRR